MPDTVGQDMPDTFGWTVFEAESHRWCFRRSRPSHGSSAGTERSPQGRAGLGRGEANPCGRAPFWHSGRIDGRLGRNTIAVISAGGLGATREEWDSKGKETVGFRSLWLSGRARIFREGSELLCPLGESRRQFSSPAPASECDRSRRWRGFPLLPPRPPACGARRY